jgi:hypothetical protein
MKKLLNLVGVGALLLLAFAIPAPAQISNAVDLTTAFPFYAGNAKLPAGSYRITPSGFSGNLLLIESTTGGHSAFIEYTPTQAEAAHKNSDVGFKKYGTAEVLSTIWVAGQKFGMQIEVSKFEANLASKGTPTAHTVTAKGQ